MKKNLLPSILIALVSLLIVGCSGEDKEENPSSGIKNDVVVSDSFDLGYTPQAQRIGIPRDGELYLNPIVWSKQELSYQEFDMIIEKKVNGEFVEVYEGWDIMEMSHSTVQDMHKHEDGTGTFRVRAYTRPEGVFYAENTFEIFQN